MTTRKTTNTGVSVRPARQTDAAAWERMRQALWPSPEGEHAGEIAAYFRGEMEEPAEIFIAFDEREDPVGFAEVSIRNCAEGCEPGRVAFLEGWYVEPQARRRGVGAALVDAVAEWARAQELTELASDTEIENTLSEAAHKALGFQEVNRSINFRKRL